MKKYLLTFGLILSVAISPEFIALADSEQSGGPQMIAVGQTTSNRDSRPKAPSRQSIYCYYDGSSLYFSFAYSEGDCDLTVSSASGIQFYTFSSDAPESVFIGAVSGASITILTEAGNTYVGEIE
ncbi:MAG: hypothetical protein LIP09_13960 [Bacteroidales bacterium]|nr:hypothetical protein [Bacteroidales bacterium]